MSRVILILLAAGAIFALTESIALALLTFAILMLISTSADAAGTAKSSVTPAGLALGSKIGEDADVQLCGRIIGKLNDEPIFEFVRLKNNAIYEFSGVADSVFSPRPTLDASRNK